MGLGAAIAVPANASNKQTKKKFFMAILINEYLWFGFLVTTSLYFTHY
jgi:hypothetical protein